MEVGSAECRLSVPVLDCGPWYGSVRCAGCSGRQLGEHPLPGEQVSGPHLLKGRHCEGARLISLATVLLSSLSLPP